MKKQLFVSLFFVLLSACTFAQTETRQLESFDQVAVSGSFDVIMEKGNKEEVRIECKGDYEPEDIKTEVEGSKLRIKPKKNNGWGWSKSGSVKIYLTYKSVKSVSSSGSSDIVSKSPLKAPSLDLASSGSGDMKFEIDCNDLSVALSGSSDITLTGRADNAGISLSGSSDVDAMELSTKTCEIRVSGSGDVKVSVSDNLDAKVSGSGNITYKGKPDRQHVKISGSGDIRQVN
ncbi:head GIN domain-containing protein [Limibacter armeniacum]|uniref:head GIN domain-containing protein n=1 Tax=Limibacter armeniacum TaxID=466084 RepID=UPI002FE6AA48